MLATKFIIALCPATPIYLASIDPVFREGMNIGQATTRDRAAATQFNTFEAAMEVAKCITGWGGAQRVEQIAVEVEDTRSTLDTPEARIEVRDNATAQYNAAREAGYAERNAAEEVANDLRDCGLKVGVDYRDGASCTVSLHLADHLGNLLTLDWDPMQDGFSYETEGDDACDIGETEAQHEAEPEAEPDHGCAGNCAPLSRKAARALRKWGKEKCQRAWHINRLRGEGLTVCSIETGIPVRSVNSAINAWQEVWAQLFVPQTCSDCGETNDTVRILDLGDGGHALCSKCNTPDIIPCDGCDSTDAEPETCPNADPNCECCGGSGVRIDFFPGSAVSGSTSDCECTWEPRAESKPDTVTCDGCEANDAEPCGDSEGFAFCAACRAKSQDAPKAAHAVDFDPAFLDSVLGRDDLTFDQTPLTPEQAKRARATLTASLMMLVLDHLPRLASSALTEARDNA